MILSSYLAFNHKIHLFWFCSAPWCCLQRVHASYSWTLQADPPTVVVATVASLCQMLEKHILDLGAMRVLVIDEVTGESFWLLVTFLILNKVVLIKYKYLIYLHVKSLIFYVAAPCELTLWLRHLLLISDIISKPESDLNSLSIVLH